MSSGFKLDIGFSLFPINSGLLIPAYSRRDRNQPFVQTMGQDNLIRYFSPYFSLEACSTYSLASDRKYENVEIIRSVGDHAIIMFRFDEEIFCYENVDDLKQWTCANEQLLEKCPLLKSALFRISGYSLGNRYLTLENVAARRLSVIENRRAWINGSVLLHQQNASLWRDIEKKPPSRRPTVSTAAVDPEEYSDAYLLSWLTNSGNYDDPEWENVWLYAEDRFSLDDTLFDVGFKWLGYIYANWHVELYDYTSLMARLIQYEYIAFSLNKPFVDFLSEVFCESIEDAVAADFPFHYHQLAIELALKEMSVDDQLDFFSAAIALLAKRPFDLSFIVDRLIELLNHTGAHFRKDAHEIRELLGLVQKIDHRRDLEYLIRLYSD